MKNTVALNQNVMFRRLYYQGKTTHTRLVALYYRRNQLRVNRLGITVSGKIGKAVVRNKIRRRIKEAYRLLESSISRAGWDVVIVARKAIVGEGYDDISRSVFGALKKANLI